MQAVRPEAVAVGVDFSPPMLAAARRRFAGDDSVELLEHDLTRPLPALGGFDLIVSAFAVHQLPTRASATSIGSCSITCGPAGGCSTWSTSRRRRRRCTRSSSRRSATRAADEDPSDRPVAPWIQARWLAEIGFTDADCHWKWRELALIGGRRALTG